MNQPNTGGGGWGSVIFGALILAAAPLTYWCAKDWIDNLNKGPTPITTEQLLAMGEGKEPPSRWVSYTSSGDFVRTKVELVKNKVQVVGEYVVVPVGARFVIARVDPSHTGRSLSGTLSVWNDDKDQEAVGIIQANVGNEAGRLLQFQFDAQRNPATDVNALYLGIGLMGLLGAVLLFTGLFAKGGPMNLDRDPPEYELTSGRDKLSWTPR